jgi:hypothetical protein
MGENIKKFLLIKKSFLEYMKNSTAKQRNKHPPIPTKAKPKPKASDLTKT